MYKIALMFFLSLFSNYVQASQFLSHPLMLVGTYTDKDGEFIGVSCTTQIIEWNSTRSLMTARHCIDKDRTTDISQYYILSEVSAIERLAAIDRYVQSNHLILREILHRGIILSPERFQKLDKNHNDIVVSTLYPSELSSITPLKVATKAPQKNDPLKIEGYPSAKPKTYSPCVFDGVTFFPANSKLDFANIGQKIICENADDAYAVAGLSGGAVLNQDGEVVGIATGASTVQKMSLNYEDLTRSYKPLQTLNFQDATSFFSNKRFSVMKFKLDETARIRWIEALDNTQSLHLDLQQLRGQISNGTDSITHYNSALSILGRTLPSKESSFADRSLEILVDFAKSQQYSSSVISAPAKLEIDRNLSIDSHLLAFVVDTEGRFLPVFFLPIQEKMISTQPANNTTVFLLPKG